jgi:hypothetical protein
VTAATLLDRLDGVSTTKVQSFAQSLGASVYSTRTPYPSLIYEVDLGTVKGVSREAGRAERVVRYSQPTSFRSVVRLALEVSDDEAQASLTAVIWSRTGTFRPAASGLTDLFTRRASALDVYDRFDWDRRVSFDLDDADEEIASLLADTDEVVRTKLGR